MAEPGEPVLPPPRGDPLPGPQASGARDTPRGPSPFPRDRPGRPALWIVVVASLAVFITAIGVSRALSGHRQSKTSAGNTTAGGSTSAAPQSSASSTIAVGATTTAATPITPTTTVTTASGDSAGSAPASAEPSPATSVDVTAAPAPGTSLAAESTAAPPSSISPGSTAPAPTTPARSSDGRVVVISSRVEACQFGPRCLVTGFSLKGFKRVPPSFTCEFANGKRISFDLAVATVSRACSTGRIPDSITIEVDGVRSETVTIP